MRPANSNSKTKKSCLLALHRACDGLPQDQLDLLLRVYGSGASYVEVAIEQDVPTAIIRGEVAKARLAAIRRQQRRPHPVYGRGAFEPELLEQLVAHVDGELDPVEQSQIEQRLRHDDAAKHFVWELEKTKRQLRRLWTWMDARPSLYLAEVAASSRAAEADEASRSEPTAVAEGQSFHDFVRELAAYAEGELEDPAARALVARIQHDPHLRQTAAEVCTAVTELRQIYSRSDVTELPEAMVNLLRLVPLHVPPRFARRVDRG